MDDYGNSLWIELRSDACAHAWYAFEFDGLLYDWISWPAHWN